MNNYIWVGETVFHQGDAVQVMALDIPFVFIKTEANHCQKVRFDELTKIQDQGMIVLSTAQMLTQQHLETASEN